MSGLGELLESVRTFYLERFRQAIDEHETDPEHEAVIEAPVLDAEGEVIREGVFKLPSRGDLYVLRDGECSDSLLIDTDRMLSFDPVEFTWEGSLRVELAPFQWNMCPLALSPVPASEQLRALTHWFERWFEASDAAEPPFFGCVHYMSDPDQQGEECQLALDLGSAPLEAFEELLDACRSAGATRVRIGQPEDVSEASGSRAPKRRSKRSRRRNPRRR